MKNKHSDSMPRVGRYLVAALGLGIAAAAQAGTDYQSIILGDSPLAYYALNPGTDGTNTAPDLSGNGNDGSGLDVAIATGPTAFITNAANFGGKAAIDLSQQSNAGLLDFTGPITLEAWAQPSNAGEFGDVVAKGYDSSTYDEISIRVNGSYYGENYFGTSGSVGISGGAETTNWAYMVLSSDGNNCTLYQNGVQVAQSADTTGSILFDDDWVIGNGSSSGNGRFFNGNITEVAIYNYGLSAAQVLTHYYYGEVGASPAVSAPIITTQPQPQQSYVGGSAIFSAAAISGLATTNQWYFGSTPLAGQTALTLKLTNLQLDDAGSYSVVVGNANGTATSAAATLAVATPLPLAWSANANSGVWDTGISANWINPANDQQVVFQSGDQALFSDTQGVPLTVTVSNTIYPSLIQVDASANDFTIQGPGTIGGSGVLNKEGSSLLTIVAPANFTGPVTIGGGALYAGNNCFGSVSSITISNGATMDLGGGSLPGNKPVMVSGAGLNGEGAIYNSYADYPGESVDITLQGDTKFGGSARWDLASGSQITGAYNLILDWSAGGGYSQWNSVSVDGVNSITVTNNSSLGMTGMDNSFQNPADVVNITGGSSLTFYSGGFNGSLSTAGQVTVYNGNLTFGGSSIHVLGGGLVSLYSSGINFTGNELIFDNNSQWVSYYNSGANTFNNAVTLNGVVHFVLGDHSMIYTNVVSGPGGFVLDYYNNDVVFSATNTYSGPTIIGSSGNSPVVVLTGDGSISQSSLIFFGGNSFSTIRLDASGRNDQTLTLASGQTLAGIGAVNGSLVVSPGATIAPSGTNTTIGITTGANSFGALLAEENVTLEGTTVLKLNTGGSNDVIEAGSDLTYGGALELVNISGAPLAVGDSFDLFSAGSLAGSFASVSPATPGPGLAWDMSQLDSGIIGVIAGVPSPTIGSVELSSGSLVFGGSGGTANGTYYVLTTTNLATPLANWSPIATNTYDANGNFSVTNALISGSAPHFFSIEQ